MLGLKLNHVSKRGHRRHCRNSINFFWYREICIECNVTVIYLCLRKVSFNGGKRLICKGFCWWLIHFAAIDLNWVSIIGLFTILHFTRKRPEVGRALVKHGACFICLVLSLGEIPFFLLWYFRFIKVCGNLNILELHRLDDGLYFCMA